MSVIEDLGLLEQFSCPKCKVWVKQIIVNLLQIPMCSCCYPYYSYTADCNCSALDVFNYCGHDRYGLEFEIKDWLKHEL